MKRILHFTALLALLASAACTQSPAGSSFDFSGHGVAGDRALYEY